MRNPLNLTLCVVLKGKNVLLGMKKRGFGKGNWNGFGGKIEPGETIEQAAIRECKEEAGITVAKIEERGKLIFTFENNNDVLHVHVFVVLQFEGEPTESEEMKPDWFSQDKIPYALMWPDDIHWLPRVLAGKSVYARFHLYGHDQLLYFEVQDLDD